MSKKVYDELVEKRTAPTVADIGRLMRTVGPKGKKHDEKREIVQRLFDELGIRSTNPQGFSVTDSLDAYDTW